MVKRVNKSDDFLKDYYTRRASELSYKSAVAKRKGDKLSKITGYSKQAMRLSLKSDKFAIKAAKARRDIARNEWYISKMNLKYSAISGI